MQAVSELTAHTGFLMRMVSNAVLHEFARKMADEGVTVAEWAMLRSLYQSAPMAPSILARKMGMTKGAISKLADRLLEKELIARESNQEDKRGHSLSLTPKADTLVPVLTQLADENDAAFFSELADEEHALLKAMLQKLITQHNLKSTPID